MNRTVQMAEKILFEILSRQMLTVTDCTLYHLRHITILGQAGCNNPPYVYQPLHFDLDGDLMKVTLQRQRDQGVLPILGLPVLDVHLVPHRKLRSVLSVVRFAARCSPCRNHQKYRLGSYWFPETCFLSD